MKLNYTEANLREIKAKIEEAYPQLNDVDLGSTTGGGEEMLQLIENKLRLTRYELQKIINEF